MIFTYTPTERLQLEAIDREELAAQQKLGQIFKQYEVGSEEAQAAKQDYQQGAAKREAALTSLLAAMDAAHFKTLGTPAAILADARQQAEDAIVYIYARTWKYTPDRDKQKGKHFIVNFASGGLYVYPLGWDYEADFIQQKAAVFKPADSSILLDAAGTTSYIMREVLAKHIEALKDKPEGAQLQGIVDSIVQASPYTVDPDAAPAKAEIITADSAIFKANMPMYHGKATDVLAALSNRDITANTIADKAIIESEAGDYKVVIQKFSKIKGKLSVNTHKLLCTGIAEFTQINNYGGGAINPSIAIPFEEYARRLGYEIDERPTDTPEAAAKEKRRAQEAVKTAKKRIRQDLELLQAMRWTWQEKVRGKGADFDSILLLERVAIRKGYIIMEFGRNMAEYLKQLPLTQYPQGLLAIDARSENAYRIGLKMAEHFSIDNNQIRGTATRLKVSTLLAVTQLPTIDTLQHEAVDNSRQWNTRIKEPFEAALDVLTGKVISNWEYVKPKGEPLTDAEAYSITDYNTFSSLLVEFELLEAPDHEERLARRAEEKKAAAARKAAKEKRGRAKKQ